MDDAEVERDEERNGDLRMKHIRRFRPRKTASEKTFY